MSLKVEISGDIRSASWIARPKSKQILGHIGIKGKGSLPKLVGTIGPQ